MDSFRIFNFQDFRIGDKVAGAYLLQVYRQLEGLKYIIIDPSYDTSFPIKQYFPDISDFVIETKKSEEIYNLLRDKGFEGMSFGNLWIKAPSIKQDTGILPRMVLPQYVTVFKNNIKVDDDKKIQDYKVRIINHCLLTADYNIGRNHNEKQWVRVMNRIRDYITDNNLDAIVVDTPQQQHKWNVQQISALLSLGNLYIGGDTGFTHMFAALHNDDPIVAIYGDSKHDEVAFEDERVRMNCSHQWCSEPLSNNVHRLNMVNNLFDEDVVFNKVVELINQKLKDGNL